MLVAWKQTVSGAATKERQPSLQPSSTYRELINRKETDFLLGENMIEHGGAF